MELINNLLQFLAALLGFGLAGIRYWKKRSQAYFLLTCFYGCFTLGSLYWTLYLLLFSKTPQVFYVSEFGWISSAIFLRILQYTLSSGEERSFKCNAAWLSLIIGVPLFLFFCSYGDILSNLLWCAMMIIISYCSIRGLAYAEKQIGCEKNMKYFHIVVLCYVAAEYALWISGCFWQNNSFLNPNFWFDILLTCCILWLLPATRRAVVS